MIPSLKNECVLALDAFVRRTTVTADREDVAKYILYFIERNRPNKEVCSFLAAILLKDELLEKTAIVTETELYNTYFTVTKEGIRQPYGNSTEETLGLYQKEADNIYLNLRSFDGEGEEAKSVRKRAREKDNWRMYFDQRKDMIVELLLNERQHHLWLFELTKEPKAQQTAAQWLKLIAYCSR